MPNIRRNNKKISAKKNQNVGNNEFINKFDNLYNQFSDSLNLSPFQKAILPYVTGVFLFIVIIFSATALVLSNNKAQIAKAACQASTSLYNGQECLTDFQIKAKQSGYQGPLLRSNINCFFVGQQTGNGCDKNGNVKQYCDSLDSYTTNGEYYDPYKNVTLVCD